MGRKNRLIKMALDVLTGEVLDAEEIFHKQIVAFEVRKQYQEGKITHSCCECDQQLGISGSKHDKLHFKHLPHHDVCVLSDSRVSFEEKEIYYSIVRGKESERHKYLKNRIGNYLSKVDGVEQDSINIDSRFIIRDDEKRKPDVYCKYYGKELVFEIQLSALSLGYILSRYNFYKNHGIYLIWILDNFDVRNPGTLERDIKYLTGYQNFFKVDETSSTFKLECEYKCPYLTPGNDIQSHWEKKSVELCQITFDSQEMQIYYYNYVEKNVTLKIEQQNILTKINEEEQLQMEEHANKKAVSIINEIKKLKDSKSTIYYSASKDINFLNDYEAQIFNSVFNKAIRKNSTLPPLLRWIKELSTENSDFLLFVLGNKKIVIDTNEINAQNTTAFQELNKTNIINKSGFLIHLFKRGYKLTANDILFIQNMDISAIEKRNKEVFYNLINNITDRSLVDIAWMHSKILFILESLKQKEIIGFNYNQGDWIAFANNVIQYHYAYWEFIESAIKYYELWETFHYADKNKTFHNKLKHYYSVEREQHHDLDHIFRELYPEIAFNPKL